MDYLTFKITLAIRLSLQVYSEPSYKLWAENWLNSSDRSKDAADAAAAADAAYAAYAAAAAADAADAAYAAAADAAAAYADLSIKYSLKAGAKVEKEIAFL